MRLKTLNGAPRSATLDFSPEALLHPDVAHLFLQQDTLPLQYCSDVTVKWRHAAPPEQRLRSDWSQPYLPQGAFHGSDPTVSFSVPGIAASVDVYQEDTTNMETTMTQPQASFENEFVYHSLILHDTLLSSQIAFEGEDRTVASQSLLTASFGSTTSVDTDSFQLSITDRPVLRVPSTLKLTTLRSLPTAAHLRSIYPQTPTPNLLCVLTASPETRDVFVKKGGYRMQLREMLVADDTRSGFKISFWQKPSVGEESQNSLRDILQSVKTGDILLLRNIALNAFRDEVYGQSLNPSIARVRTTIEPLMTSGVISTRQLGALPAPVLTAFMRLKKWSSLHVATDGLGLKRKGDFKPSGRLTRASKSDNVHDATLPPDTMEAT